MVGTTQAPRLTYKTIPLPPDTQLPPMLKYSYLQTQLYQTAMGGALGAGEQRTVTGQNMMFDRIPKYIFIYVREKIDKRTINQTDTFATIDNVTINFNGLTGQLSSATQADLLQMSQDCGSRQSLIQFTGKAKGFSWVSRGTQGSLLCLEFGRHIPLGTGVQVGSAGSFNMTVQVQCTNNAVNVGVGDTGVIAEPYLNFAVMTKRNMIVKDKSIFLGSDEAPALGGVILGGSFNLSQAINGKIPLQKVEYNSHYGGSWWGNAWNAIKSFAKNTKVLSEVAKTIPTVGAPISKAIASYGYGVEGGSTTIAPPKSGGSTVTKAKLASLISKL
jgi:hypothetical protein